MFGALDFADFAYIAIIVMLMVVFFGGSRSPRQRFLQAGEQKRFRRIEEKLDLLLRHHDLQYEESKYSAWQELADDPARKIGAIAAYREEHGASLADAKEAVEEYIRNK